MPRNIPLTLGERAAIRRMRIENPQMSLREIGEPFNVTYNAVFMVLNAKDNSKPLPDIQQKRAIGPNPQPEGSCIRALTPAQLMAGNGTVCRSRRDAA